MGTKEFGEMLIIIQTLEAGRVPAKEAKNWRIEEEKKIITRKEYLRLANKFEMEGSMAHKRPVEPCKALHEENFWSIWLREDERSEEERMANAEKEEEKGEKRKREEEKE